MGRGCPPPNLSLSCLCVYLSPPPPPQASPPEKGARGEGPASGSVAVLPNASHFTACCIEKAPPCSSLPVALRFLLLRHAHCLAALPAGRAVAWAVSVATLACCLVLSKATHSQSAKKDAGKGKETHTRSALPKCGSPPYLAIVGSKMGTVDDPFQRAACLPLMSCKGDGGEAVPKGLQVALRGHFLDALKSGFSFSKAESAARDGQEQLFALGNIC